MLEEPIVAKCLKLEYQPGEYDLISGVKGHQAGKKKGNRWYRNRGYGWGEYVRPSKFILHVRIGREKARIWVDRFFKDHLGRLTEKNRDLIKAAMPKTVRVRRCESARGTVYYQVWEADLQTWHTRLSQTA